MRDGDLQVRYLNQTEHPTVQEYNEYQKRRIAKAKNIQEKRLDAIANSMMTWAVGEVVHSKEPDVVLQVEDSDDYPQHLGPPNN